MSVDKVKGLYAYLSYAGSVPFILCAVGLLMGIDTLPVFGQLQHVLGTYSLLIAAFMAGSHWGQQFGLQNEWRIYLPVGSNLMVVCLWLLSLWLPLVMMIPLFVIHFLILLWIDQRLLRLTLISSDYFRVRCRVTCIVVAMLLCSAIYI